MKIALAHDSLVQYGGAERVLQALHDLYPDAPVFTLVYDRKLGENFENWTIISSPLQYIYNLIPRFKWLLPLIPAAVASLDFSDFDVVISSSSVFIKAIRVPKNVLHISYCHTPARFLWAEKEEYLAQEAPAWLRPFARLFLKMMRSWDYRAAQRVNYFIANSENIKQKIEQFYKRDSAVIYPPVSTDFFHPTLPKPTLPEDNFYLLAGRLQAYKQGNLVIKAFNKSGRKLHVIGTGRAEAELRDAAGPNIEFFGRVDDRILRDQYSEARAYIFPQEEDFGIMPVEAMACGTPVIAYGKGGALETVVEDKTGLFFYEQTAEALNRTIDRAENKIFFAEDLFEQAEEFSKAAFEEKISKFVEVKYGEYKN